MKKDKLERIKFLTSEIIENDLNFMIDENDCLNFDLQSCITETNLEINNKKEKIDNIINNNNKKKENSNQEQIPSKLTKRKRSNMTINSKNDIPSNKSQNNISDNVSQNKNEKLDQTKNSKRSKLNMSKESSKIGNIFSSQYNENIQKDLNHSFKSINENSLIDLETSIIQKSNPEVNMSKISFGRENIENSQSVKSKDNNLYNPDKSLSLLDISQVNMDSFLIANEEVSILIDQSQDMNPDDKLKIHMTEQLQILHSCDMNEMPTLRAIDFQIENDEYLSIVQMTAKIQISVNIVFTLQLSQYKNAKLDEFRTIVGFNDFLNNIFDQDNIDGFLSKQNTIDLELKKNKNLENNKKVNKYDRQENKKGIDGNEICPKCKNNKSTIEKQTFNSNGIQYGNQIIKLWKCQHVMCLSCAGINNKIDCQQCGTTNSFDVSYNKQID